jgi:PAS domain S-box-containing protein
MTRHHHRRLRLSPKSAQESRKVRTGSKALEELLRASEERFKQFFETWPEYCYMISPSGNILDVNPAACKALGYDKEELIGRHVSAIYAPESLSKMGDVFEKWKRSGEVHDEELVVVTKQGQKRTVLLSARSVKDAEGSVLHSTSVQVDITDRKQAEDARRVSGELFNLMSNAAPVMIWMSGTDKLCTYFNKPWLDFTGRPIESELGNGWTERVHPEDFKTCLDTYIKAFDRREKFSMEYRIRRYDGEYRWILDNGVPRQNEDGSFAGYIGSCLDVTERKLATEAAYKATRQTSLEHIVAVVANSATAVREALQRTLDAVCEIMEFPVGHALIIYDDEPELLKSTHVVHVNDIKRFVKLFEMSTRMTWPTGKGTPGEVMRTGKPIIHDMTSEYSDLEKHPRFDAMREAGLQGGMVIPVLADNKVEAILEFGSYRPVASDKELRDTLTATSERLSRFFERRRAQIKFQKQKEELEAAAQQLFVVAGRVVNSQEEERRRIARELHDDFSQRLALVSMKITSLAGRDRPLSSGELNADLEDVRESISAVAEDLHGLSRQLHPARLELLGLVRALRSQCSEFERNRGIKTVFKAMASDDDASPQAATCLYRVLQESLMNVAKHSGSKSAYVSLDRQHDQLELRIRDEGHGFELGIAGGIGLRNIEERVRLLNGKLVVKSSPGKGTEITVRVPAVARIRQ